MYYAICIPCFQLVEVEIELVNLIHQAIACTLQSSRNFAVQCVKGINRFFFYKKMHYASGRTSANVVRLVMRLMYKDGHKRHYPFKRMRASTDSGFCCRQLFLIDT